MDGWCRSCPAGRPQTPGSTSIAATWGGLVASIGLLAGAERDWPARLAAGAISLRPGRFPGGGPGGRPAAAARRCAAWLIAYVIHAVFIGVARVIDALGGPDAPPLLAGGPSAWGAAGAWTLLWALARRRRGQRLAAPRGPGARLLAPQGERRDPSRSNSWWNADAVGPRCPWYLPW